MNFFITVFSTDKLKFTSSSTVSGLFTITGYLSVNILQIAKTWEGFMSDYPCTKLPSTLLEKSGEDKVQR